MRIIAGTARGIVLKSPTGSAIRPTLDRVRESLFNILSPRLEEARFLDLYAGTGANGLEALSRGAREVVFVESAPAAQELIRENYRKTRLEGRVSVLPYQLPERMDKLAGPFDIIFADPPYAAEAAPLLEAMAKLALLAPEGVLVLEHDKKYKVEAAPPLELTRERTYGGTTLSFFAWGSA